MPNRKNPTNSGGLPISGPPLTLERKLELLESRFTQPNNDSRNRQGAAPPAESPSVATETFSNHSFSFNTPSRTSNESSNLPSSAMRSRRKPSISTSFHAVEKATTLHLEKLAGATPPANQNNIALSSTLLLQEAGNQRSLSGFAHSAMSAPHSSHSNQTLLTSHVNVENSTNANKNNNDTSNNTGNNRVVAESPPIIVSPHDPNAAGAAASSTKPTVARNLPMSLKNATASNVSSTATHQKRKSVPKRKQPSVKDKALPKNSPNDSKKRTRIQATAKDDGGSRSPKTNTTATGGIASFASTVNEQSRDRSNPTSKASKSKPPANNKLIHDFFSSATTTKKKAGNSTLAATNNNASKAGSGKAAASSSSSSTNNVTNELAQKCQKLEQLVQDKDEQLKAVANNRTILQSALQTALNKKNEEYDSLKKETELKQEQTSQVLEELLRWKSNQQAKELRERLATDGARLGRIVYARTGMRAVESWEEGYATKDLEDRKKELKSKKAALEKRYKKFEEDKENGSVTQLEAIEAKEAVRMHLNNIRQKEKDLAEEENALNDEKGAHIRALKRVASEDSSRFRSRPKLNDRYVLECLLGKGGFSEVWRGFDLVELREVAVKIHQLDPRWSDSKKENYTKHVSREYEIHRNVRHPRIVSLYDVFEIDANSFATVLECCKGTDLDALLKKKRRLSESDARAILIQILNGMNYLSQPAEDGSRQGIIHYDLKPGNILFDECGDAKITDFGLSKLVDAPDPDESMELTSQGAGTYWYLPPECFITDETVRISNKVDVWSIGVIYYQMLFGRRPFGEGKTQDKLLSENTMLNAQEVSFPEKTDVSDEAKEFIRQCLMYDQAFRPTVGQLCKNSYILKQNSSSV